MGVPTAIIHEFVIGRESYGPKDMADLDHIVDEEGVTQRLMLGARKTFVYVYVYDYDYVYVYVYGYGYGYGYGYDYGDDWRHKVKIETIVPLDGPISSNVCMFWSDRLF